MSIEGKKLKIHCDTVLELKLINQAIPNEQNCVQHHFKAFTLRQSKCHKVEYQINTFLPRHTYEKGKILCNCQKDRTKLFHNGNYIKKA